MIFRHCQSSFKDSKFLLWVSSYFLALLSHGRDLQIEDSCIFYEIIWIHSSERRFTRFSTTTTTTKSHHPFRIHSNMPLTSVNLFSSKSCSCSWKPWFGLATDRPVRTTFSASFHDNCVTDIMYATATVTDRDMPAKQCIKTLPSRKRAACIKSLQTEKYCDKFWSGVSDAIMHK